MKTPILIAMVFMLALSTPGSSFAEKQWLHEIPNKVQAPEFKLLDFDGKTHRLSDYKGKVVIVNFWATWCPPCRYEMPSMEKARLLFENDPATKNKIVILAINVGEDADTIFTFTADYPVNFPLLLDLDSQVIKQWPVIGLPTTYVVDPKGKIVMRAIGSREWDDANIVKQLFEVAD
jgi:thiol-disulfide isomerase/thioredoxin